MALGSGLAAQIGYGVETTSGTPVAPSFYVPLADSDTLTHDRARIDSASIIAGRRVRTSNQWGEGNITVGGDVPHELPKRGVGKLFTVMFGDVVTTGSGPYTHTFTPGDLSNKSLTIQKGVPAVNGTVYPMNFSGMKVDSWEIAATAGEFVTFSNTYVGMRAFGHRTVTDGVTTNGSPNITSSTAAFSDADIGTPISGTGIPAGTVIRTVTSSTAATLGDYAGAAVNATAAGTGVTFTFGIALGTATYATGVDDPFTFVNAGLTLGGTVANVKSFTLSGNNGLDADRRFLGKQGTTAEPLEAAHRQYSGEMEIEFDGLTNYTRYLNGTEVACVATFQSGADSVTITMNVRLDGETPQISGTGIVTMNTPFTAFASGADSTAITAVLVNGDVTP